MELKKRISVFLNKILEQFGITQKELASLLGIKQGRLSMYVQGKELPNLEIVIKIAELGGVSVDELIKTDIQPKKEEIYFAGNGNIVPINGDVNIDSLHQGDIYNNTSVKKTYKYTYQNGDLTEEQAAILKEIVDEIVTLEKLLKQKPKTYAGVWGALKRKFKVGYYRKIPEDRFEEAKSYLKQWIGRLERQKKAPNSDPDFRKKKYTAINTVTKKELGWSKEYLTNYIFAEFKVESLKDLSDSALTKLYNRVMNMKNKT